MIGRMARWTVLALLAFSPLAAAVSTLTLTTMTFSNDGTVTTLVVCTSDAITTGAGIVVQLVVQNSDGQNSYSSVETDATLLCATFTIDGTALPPLDLETTYELVVGADGLEQQSGTVTFAFPEGETFICSGTATFGRFKAMDPSTVDVAQWLCLQPDAPSVCYFEINAANPNCLTGLDLEHQSFEVCTDLAASLAPPIESFSVVLTYTEDRMGGTFTVTDNVTQGPPSELLHKTAPDGTYSVSSCDGAPGCASSDFAPSPNDYDLCAVYTGPSGDITDFGATIFQDLQLTVDAVDATEVIFRFVNKDPLQKEPGLYEVESGSDESLGGTGFTLDCTQIPADGMCNGFFIEDPPPQMIAVSYDNQNKVLSPVPAFIPDAKEHVEQSKYASAADFIQ